MIIHSGTVVRRRAAETIIRRPSRPRRPPRGVDALKRDSNNTTTWESHDELNRWWERAVAARSGSDLHILPGQFRDQDAQTDANLFVEVVVAQNHYRL